MKALTIRMKVTLWYAFFMLVLIAVSLIFISDLSSKAMLTNQKGNLIETVTDATNEMVSPVNFDYFENGIYLLVYDDNKSYVNGIVPEDFSTAQPLRDDYVQTIETASQTFYVYDKSFQKDGLVYWIRGVVIQTAPDPIGALTVSFVSGVLPAIVIMTCVIGYFITKRAFRPVKQIQETAQSIADSNQLSLRIGLPEGTDEIAKLGKTVDHMLDKLQQSFEKEKQFTDDVSHELRTPLAVILTESEYTLQHARSLEEASESMEVVNRQANRMSVLINQLLFFSRSENGSLILNKEIFGPIPVITELVQDYHGLAEIKEITISFANSLDRNLELSADKELFTRSLSNIIQNAMNYSDPGGYIEVAAAQTEDSIAITVSDDGIGISSDNIDKIWDRFYQVEESRSKAQGNNMGLGLSMVKTIMEKHGGHVTVDSTLGEGSTFTLYFPI